MWLRDRLRRMPVAQEALAQIFMPGALLIMMSGLQGFLWLGVVRFALFVFLWSVERLGGGFCAGGLWGLVQLVLARQKRQMGRKARRRHTGGAVVAEELADATAEVPVA